MERHESTDSPACLGQSDWINELCVVCATDLTDQFLGHILDGHQTCRATELVHHDGDGRPFISESRQQLFHRGHLGNKGCRSAKRTQSIWVRCVSAAFEKKTSARKDADDLVEVLRVKRDPLETALRNEIANRCRLVLDTYGEHRNPRGHDVSDPKRSK